MEKKGLIARESVAHDARCKRIVLTDKADAIVADLKANGERVERLLVDGFFRKARKQPYVTTSVACARTSTAHNANLNIKHPSVTCGDGSPIKTEQRLLTRRRRTNERYRQRQSRRRAKAVEPDKPKHVHSRTLGHSIREYKKASILAPVFVAVEGILEILIPTIMASLIDEGVTGGSMPATVKFGVILLVCAMVSLGAGFLSESTRPWPARASPRTCARTQFEKVQGFSFTSISTGSPPVRS